MTTILQRLGLVGFRSYTQGLFDFDKFTLLLGPNGSGKTSVLDAITYGLLGACHYTTVDGKGAPALAFTGRSDFEVDMTFEAPAPLLSIRRQRGQKSHELIVQGSNGHAGPNAIHAQQFILDALAIPHETLLALLDPRPLLGREEKSQRDILLRVLRPPTIQVTERLQTVGIKQILDVEHLDRLHSDLKTGKLRDLKRDKNAIRPEDMEVAPWPYAGWTEETLGKALAARRSEHEAALRKVGGLRAKLQTPKPAEPTMTAAEAVEKRALADELQEQAAKIEEQVDEYAANRQKIEAEKSGAMRAVQEARGRLDSLAGKTPEKHCPTCTCPVAEQKKTREVELEKIRAEIDAAGATVKEFQDQLDIVTEAASRLTGNQAGIDRQAAAIKVDLDAYAKVTPAPMIDTAAVQAELDTAEAEAEKLQESVQRGEKCMATIAVWNRDKGAAEKKAKEFRDLMDQIPAVEAAIRELERIRESIVGEGIGPFLETMKAFLEPFGMGSIAYDGTQFLVDGRPATYLSRGQSAMFFEAAFRLAVAKRTGFPLVLLDHDSPVSEDYKGPLMGALMKADVQVIMTWTTSVRPTQPTPAGMRRYWLSQNFPDGTKVEVL